MRATTLTTAILISCAPAWAQASGEDLFQAIRNNNLSVIKTWLANGGDVNARNSRGATLLTQAAAYGSPEAVNLLLAGGADVNAKNPADATALLWAANDPKKARALIDKGADVNAHSKQGRTPLMIASTCDGCVETVRLLIAKGADVKARDQFGGSALAAAAEANDTETIRLLIDKGAELTADSAGFTPLMASAANCNADAVQTMLSKGADVNAANTFAGEVKFGKIQIVHMTPLMFAAPYCTADVVKTLLEAGAKVNERDLRQMTPLMFAVASEHQDGSVVQALLAAGADVNLKSNMGETALDWAKKFGNRQTLATLVGAGAHPGDAVTPPVLKTSSSRNPAQAVQSAAAILQRTSAEFFKQSGCVGCHHQPITAMTLASARLANIGVDSAAEKQVLTAMRTLELRQDEMQLQRFEVGGFTDIPAYTLLAFSIAQTQGDAGTETASLYIAGAQHRDGTWTVNGNSRSPIQEGVIGRSVIAARGLQVYGPPAKKTEFDERLGRLRAWLLEAKPSTNDDYAMLTLGLRWTGASDTRVKAAGAALVARQRGDGGWAQNSNLSSDAYATGETLWALREAGVLKVSDPEYKRGAQFLLSTQNEDGSWYVRSRAVKLQPYFQSGFPYDHDQWISSTATGFAAMALAPAGSQQSVAQK